MSTVAPIASVALGLAFLTAGGSKLAAGEAWPTRHGVSVLRRSPIPVLPWLELVVGAALVFQILPPIPAIVAAGAAGGVHRAASRHGSRRVVRPPCACFGAWSAKPIGPWHLVRNGALIVVGLVALAG